MYLRSFGSDNHATVHPRIMDAIREVNHEQVPSYGTDHWSESLKKVFKKEFGEQVDSHLVFNGTAANVLSLRAMVRNYQSVFCSDISHLFQDECAAPEVIGGVKLIPVPAVHGKLTIDELEKLWRRRGDQHFAQTQGISITQPTEVGTVYSFEELKALTQWAKHKRIRIHIDGARLANAAVCLGKGFREFTTELGVDVISFGGSKNGLMLGEAIIFCNPALAQDFNYIRKQCLQLPSKSRFIAAQFLAYFQDQLWYQLADHSLNMAKELHQRIADLRQTKIQYSVDSNAVFAQIPPSWIKKLREKYFFYVWDEKDSICRWMASWDTSIDDVRGFSEQLRDLANTSASIT